MTVDSSQTVYVIMKRTDLCAVVGRIHPVSDLFSPLSSSSSSGENVILCWNKKKKKRRGDLRDFRHLFSIRARIALRSRTDTKTSKWAGYSVQPLQMLVVEQSWIILMGSLCQGCCPPWRAAESDSKHSQRRASYIWHGFNDVFISHSNTQMLQTQMWTCD